MGRYGATLTLMRPITALRRRRARRLGEINVPMFEANRYRPAFIRFRAAGLADPALLLAANLDGGLILDVGAHEGGWSNRLLRHVGEAEVQVLAFEPIAMFDWRPTDPRVTLHRYGLAGSDRTERITIEGQGSTIFGEGTHEIELRDVASLGIDRIDLAKVNIEGGEYELIDRMHEVRLLARTSTVLVQFHDFVPGAHRLRRKARRKLAETHDCTWSYSWVWERWDLREATSRSLRRDVPPSEPPGGSQITSTDEQE